MKSISSQQNNWLEKYWPAILIVAAWLWIFWPMLTGRAVCGFRDSAYLYYPLFKWIDSVWASGDIPLWNPYDIFGVPVVGDGSSSVFYPGKLIFWVRFLSYESRYGIYLAGHVLLAAATCYWFARRLGCKQAGATLAAVSYAFGGSVLFQVCNVIYLVGAAWLPAAMGCIWLMYRRRSVAWAIAGGVVCALILLGGDPQMVYHIGLIGLGTMIGQSWRARRRAQRTGDFRSSLLLQSFMQNGSLLVVQVVVTSLLAAIQIMPSQDAMKDSVRNQFSRPRNIYEVYSWDPTNRFGVDSALEGLVGNPNSLGYGHMQHVYQFSQPPWTMAELFVPNSSGKPYPINGRWANGLPGADRMWVPSLYAGCLTIVFAMMAFRLCGKRRRQVWLTRIGLFFGVGSFGWYGIGWLIGEFVDTGMLASEMGPQVGGIYWLLVVALPKYVMFRYPAKLFVIAALSLSVLAGMALSRFRWSPGSNFVRAGILAVACWILVPVVALIFETSGMNQFWNKVPEDPLFGPFSQDHSELAILTGLFQVAMVATLATAVFWLRNASTMSFCRTTIVLIAVVDLLTANSWMTGQVSSSVFKAEIVQPDTETLDHIIPYPPHWQKTSSSQRLEEIVEWQRSTLFPKHHLEIPIQHQESFSSIEQIAMAIGADYQSKMVDFFTPEPNLPPRGSIQLVESRNGYFKFDVDANEASYISILNIRNSDWHATLTDNKGQATKPKLVGEPPCTWQIVVPKGKSVIELVYLPKSFYRGAWISGFSWGMLALLVVIGTCRRLRKYGPR